MNKNTNEIIMAPDGMPLCHITDSSDKDWNKKDWSTVGSVMIGGVDRKKVGVKVEDLKAASEISSTIWKSVTIRATSRASR